MSVARAMLGSLGIAALTTTLAFAAPEGEGSMGTTVSHIAGFDHIVTDKFNYNLNTGDFTLPGPFTAEREGTDVSADRATGNSRQKVMHAEGHVVVHQTRAPANSNQPGATQEPSTLTCDKLDVDGTRRLYIATGNMHFSQEGGREATADAATLDQTNHHLNMVGHVHVRNGEQTVDADHLDYDTQTGQLDGEGDVTITSPVETPPPGPPAVKKKRHRIPL
jgi:lipopolysaccharide assembly outer membrane protein LptD (OstA)